MLGVVVALGLYVQLRERTAVRLDPLLLEFEPKDVAQVHLKSTRAADEIKLVKEFYGWPQEDFFIPGEA